MPSEIQNHHIQPRVAALYVGPTQSSKAVLKAFSQSLIHQGICVHGLLQENIVDEKGHRIGVDAIDIVRNDRIELLRPTPYETKHKRCSLNLAQLSKTTVVLRRAVEQHADIALVERFSKTESEGGGLAEDLLNLMASGVPTVVSVAKDETESWLRYCGGLAETIDCNEHALMRWWKTILH